MRRCILEKTPDLDGLWKSASSTAKEEFLSPLPPAG